MRRMLLAIALTALAGCDRHDADTPSVLVDGELLVGKSIDDGRVAAFLGVPFAEPPLGELRWRGPQPLRKKVAHRDVTAFAPACMQTMRILDWYRYMAETFGGSRDDYPDLEISEDCLYLNVWTPDLDSDAQLPVMVWVHGGSNRSGWSYEPNYVGNSLAQKGVVVVSVAYRHGAFGFVGRLDSRPDEPVANFGLWDIVASLQWIRDNIERFGGDPGRITVFGESSGAQNILALMFAGPAEGLFQRAILQSTAGFGIDRTSTPVEERRRLVELLHLVGGQRTETAKTFADFSATELLTAYEQTFADYYHSPALDGQLLTESVWQSIRAGRFDNYQLMIGTNADEWLDSIGMDATAVDLAHAAEELDQLDGSAALAVVAAEPDPREAMDRLITAEDYLCPAQSTAARMTAAGRDAWVYYFTRVRDDDGGRKVGAYHGAEYPYAFGTHDDYMLTNEIDLALTETMMNYWTSFAATGNPNGAGTPRWPKFTAPDYRVQELGDEVKTIPAPEPELCALFEEWDAQQD